MSDFTCSVVAFCASCCVSSVTFRFSMLACAALICHSRSAAASSMSGLLVTITTSLACTVTPGRKLIFSTRLSKAAGIHRYCSTTSVPKPRTSRTMGPRFTVSRHTVAPSTDGAAGLSRESPQVMSGMAATRIAM